MRGEEITSCKSHIALVSLTDCCIMIVKKKLTKTNKKKQKTVDTSRCGKTNDWLCHLVYLHCSMWKMWKLPQSHCTIQNKHMLIVIDLTINSYGEFEFTIKTMNAILLVMFTDHQRVHATYTLSYIGLGQLHWVRLEGHACHSLSEKGIVRVMCQVIYNIYTPFYIELYRFGWMVGVG